MAIRTVVTKSDPLLRKKARVVQNFDLRTQLLIDDMLDTIKKADGAGLAAPQVGVLRQIIVLNADEDAEPIVLVNPQITHQEGEDEGAEGCLSVPNKTGLVKRPKKITVVYQDRKGIEQVLRVEDFEARALCHEIDHLFGILYTDVMIRYLTDDEVRELEREEKLKMRGKRRRKRM